jgi:hypothetical protein
MTHGINYKLSDKSKSEIYQAVPPMLNSQRVELLDKVSNIRARLEVIEALLRGELSRKEARARRAKVLKRSKRGRMLLRIERIERGIGR